MLWLINRCCERLQPCTFHHNLCQTQIYLFASAVSFMYDRGNEYLYTVEEPMTRRESIMVKKVGQNITRPGNKLGDPSVTIPVAEDLLTVPGIPARESDVAFFSREYPLENMAIEESASAE